MKVAEFYYELPPELIAQEPLGVRDQSRLLVVDSARGSLEHRQFSDLAGLLQKGDVLVLNATKVFPARLRGRKATGGKIELLLLAPLADSANWKALVRGATSAAELEFADGLKGTMRRRLSEGEWEIEFSGGDLRQMLERHGEMPLPPYIKRSQPQAADLARYQTVFARAEGAVAAPTAGFHFTPELLTKLRAKGVQVLEIILHVGWGTFRPVRTERVEEHQMLAERYQVSAETATALNAARQNKQRIVAVGTTAVRTLESICGPDGKFHPGDSETNLFIYPGYHFKAVDALITNFHLPDSTPLLLACAFFTNKRTASARGRIGVSANTEEKTCTSPLRPCAEAPKRPFSLKEAYRYAIDARYRFYSYGDAMLIL